MDFITGLLKSKGKEVIFEVMDKFSILWQFHILICGGTYCHLLLLISIYEGSCTRGNIKEEKYNSFSLSTVSMLFFFPCFIPFSFLFVSHSFLKSIVPTPHTPNQIWKMESQNSNICNNGSALIFLGTGCSSAVPNVRCLLQPSDPPCSVCSQALSVPPNQNPNYRFDLSYLVRCGINVMLMDLIN